MLPTSFIVLYNCFSNNWCLKNCLFEYNFFFKLLIEYSFSKNAHMKNRRNRETETEREALKN